MASLLELPAMLLRPFWDWTRATPIHVLLVLFIGLVLCGLLAVSFSLPSSISWPSRIDSRSRSQLFILLHLVAPKPRPVLPSEKTYITSHPTDGRTKPLPLPCWYDRWLAERRIAEERPRPQEAFPTPDARGAISPAEVRLSVVFPAYNEEERVIPTLEEAVPYLDEHFGRSAARLKTATGATTGPHTKRHMRNVPKDDLGGYEIILINDGSSDKTVDVVLEFARDNGLHDIVRVVTLEKNRGKGGGVTHGFRHVRGEYVLFADADGASRFSDVGRLIEGCEEVVDGSHRGVAIGSRAHLVGSEAVVKVTSFTP